jgi:hypothetical protein
MLGRRTLGVLACLSLVASACTSIASAPSDAPSLTPSAGPSNLASVPPTGEPSTQPTLVPSASVPTATSLKTPKPPKATSSAGSGQANLVIAKFSADADPFVAFVDTRGRVTVKNIGSADAGSFSIGVSYERDDGLGYGSYSGVPVDGLDAGDSVQVEVDLSLQDTGAITFTAKADADGAIGESNEDDNTATLSVTALKAQANLVFDSFSLTVDTLNAGGYGLNYRLRNSGTANVTDFIEISFTWAASFSGDTGTFPEQQCCYAHGPTFVPGDSMGESYGPVYFPQADSYVVTAAADPANDIQESDESDNYATDAVTVP